MKFYINSSDRFINVFLRGLTLVSRFGLLLFLAKFLDPEKVGEYGLLAASIGYLVYVIGFEFYVYSNREVALNNNEVQLFFLKNQLTLGLLTYLFIMPLVWIFFKYASLPLIYLHLGMVILLFDYISLELYRYLVATQQQLKAGLLLFIRSGLWPFFVVLAMFLYDDIKNLDSVLYFWSFGSFASVVYGIYILDIQLPNNLKSFYVYDIAWIRRGLKITFPYFLAALSVQAIFVLDRFFLESILGLDILAVYVLFIGIIFAIISFIDAGIFAYLYPKLLVMAKDQEFNAFYKLFNKMIIQVVFSIVTLSSLVGVFYFYGVEYLDNEVYREYWIILPLLLLMVFFQLLGTAYQIGLYALNKDAIISNIKISLIFVFILLVWLCMQVFLLYAIPLALIFVFILQLTLYFYYFKKYKVKNYHLKINKL